MSNILCYENSLVDVLVDGEPLRVNYIRCSPLARLKTKGTVVLLHDFFRTSYQFRHVLDLFAMGGYITISPDLPGKHVGSQQRTNDAMEVAAVAESLNGMLEKIGVRQPVHLVGCGFGASIASIFATRYPKLVASVVRGTGSSKAGMQNMLSLSSSLTKQERLQAFTQYLRLKDRKTFDLSDQGIEEYAEAHVDPTMLLSMQKLCRDLGRDDSTLAPTTEKLAQAPVPNLALETLPEEEPEHVALSVLSFVNRHVSQAKSNVSADPSSSRKQATKESRL